WLRTRGRAAVPAQIDRRRNRLRAPSSHHDLSASDVSGPGRHTAARSRARLGVQSGGTPRGTRTSLSAFGSASGGVSSACASDARSCRVPPSARDPLSLRRLPLRLPPHAPLPRRTPLSRLLARGKAVETE